MKVLLDENLPKKLKQDFREIEIYTVREKGWNGIKNGELLQLMIAEKFDILFTFDKNIEHQQNFEKYPISVFILNEVDNTYHTLQRLVPKIKNLLFSELKIGVTIIKFE